MHRWVRIAAICAVVAGCIPAPPVECRVPNEKALGRRQAAVRVIIAPDRWGFAVRFQRWQFATTLGCDQE